MAFIDPMRKAHELLAQSEKYDMPVRLDGQVLVVEDCSGGDAPELQLGMAREIAKVQSAARRILAQRDSAERLKKYVGVRVWSEDREGTLAKVNDGKPVISVNLGFSENASFVTADVEKLIFLVEGSAEQNVPEANAAPAAQAQPDAVAERKRGLRKLLADSLLGKDRAGARSGDTLCRGQEWSTMRA
jgi:hypothetical protein